MSRQPTLFVAISSHGFGHLAQTAPVVGALRRRLPSLRVVVQMAAPKELLAGFFPFPFEHLSRTADVGMLMSSSLDVRVEESAAAYLDFHRDWEERVERQAELLRRYHADLVLANVPYLLPAAAERLNIPAVVLCSLNWRDIYAAYCGSYPGSAAILRQMEEAYRSARLFLQPTPSMEMAWLSNRRPIGPVARRGRDRREEVEWRLRLEPGQRLVLLSFGGIASTLPVADWPAFPGIQFVISGGEVVERTGFHSFETLGMPYIDLLCSVDALITKPGYGSFAEAACNGTPVLYVPRDGWPEAACLTTWLKEVLPCREISRAAFEKGTFVDELLSLFREPPAVPVEPSGVDEAAEALATLLG